ncbi:MAG: hypothetical protein GY801_32755 [bacterium]|nr:hypothetical protein [bacterium]
MTIQEYEREQMLLFGFIQIAEYRVRLLLDGELITRHEQTQNLDSH